MSANHRHETLSEMVGGSRNILASCECGHRGIVDGPRLARLFYVRRWDGRKHMVRDHLRCSRCGNRPRNVGVTYATPNGPGWGPGDEAAWRRLVARLRS